MYSQQSFIATLPRKKYVIPGFHMDYQMEIHISYVFPWKSIWKSIIVNRVYVVIHIICISTKFMDYHMDLPGNPYGNP